MKKLFVIIALLSVNFAFGQATEQEVKNLMWKSAGPDFEKTEIPTDWEKESAVIIAQEFKYNYDKYGVGSTKLRFIEQIHKRIKLLDKAAIESYSELSFADEITSKRGRYTKSSILHFGIKVVKPDGSENIIDMTDAVDVEGDGSTNIKKIAIPNLEINDILDYYFYAEEAFVTSSNYEFSPTITNLNKSYSIMKQRYEFTVEKNFHINFKSVNGAPNLKVREDLENKKIIYSLEDENRPKLKAKYWVYRYRVYPTVKFQVIYARKSGEDNVKAFLGESGTAKQKVSDQEVLALVTDNLYSNYTAKSALRSAESYLRTKKVTKNTPAETKLKLAYYYLRHELYNKSIEKSFRYNSDVGLTELKFASVMTYILKKWDIPHELLAVADRHYTSLDDLIFFNELSIVIKVNFKKPVYLSNFTMHSRYGELPSSLESAEAYAINTQSKSPTIKRVKTPASVYTNNELHTVSNIEFSNEEMNILNFDRKQEMLGITKKNYQSDIVGFFDFIIEDGDTYNSTSMFSPNYYTFSQDIEKIEEMVAKRKKLDEEARKETIKASIEDDYDVEIDTLISYEIIKRGRNMNDPKLITTEKFVIDNFVKKAGRNYILEAGKLIGGQIELDEEDRERELDVYMPFARSFKYEINIVIPEGYSVQGIDKLTTKVENETGGFSSTAIVEDGVLKIMTYKFYSNNFEKMQNWEKMQEFLDAAHNFTQKKVLLKKVS